VDLKPYVVDTSAMLAFIEDEEGADRVERILKKERAILPWLVLMEVHYVTRQEAGPGEADRRFALLRQHPAAPCPSMPAG
jgi:uncharacterized protein